MRLKLIVFRIGGRSKAAQRIKIAGLVLAVEVAEAEVVVIRSPNDTRGLDIIGIELPDIPLL
jgi:hypothetical protein